MEEHHFGDLIDRATERQKHVRLRERSHYQSMLKLQQRERLIGVPVIIATTIVGTAIFASLQSEPAIGWRIATGCLSIAAATLAAVQTFFSFGAEAQRHRAAPSVSLKCAGTSRTSSFAMQVARPFARKLWLIGSVCQPRWIRPRTNYPPFQISCGTRSAPTSIMRPFIEARSSDPRVELRPGMPVYEELGC
jgi:hypothetical protein